MVRKSALLLALMLLHLQFAAQTPLEKFLSRSFEPDQSVSVQPLYAPGGYLLVSADGKETYVADGEGRTVEDTAILQDILSADSRNRSGFAAKLASALSLDEEIMAAKDKDEKKCMQYLGLDMHPCSDRQGCTLSCFSVPQCVGGPLYSDGFLEAFMGWNTGRQEFDLLVLSYSSGQEGMAGDTAAIDQKRAVLGSLSALSSSLSMNPIFLNRSDEGCGGGGAARCYEYCPKADYSAGRIASGAQNLDGLKAALTSLQGQGARAAGILGMSRKNDDYLSSRGRLYGEFRLEMWNRLRSLNDSSASMSKQVLDREVKPMIESLAELSGRVNADAGAGYYRRALSNRTLFGSREKAILGRISDDLAKKGLLEAKVGLMETKVKNGAWLLGNYSAEVYMQELSAIKKGASLPMTLEEIAEAGERADAIGIRLDAEISAKATSHGGEKPQLAVPIEGVPPIPCPVAVAVLALAAIAFSRQ